MITNIEDDGVHLLDHEPKPRAPVPEVLRRFIWDIQSMVELADSEREILLIGRDLMHRLVASAGWLPEAFARPDPQRWQQFQLYHDDLARFTVVSTILAGGQTLPVVQDHVWQISGVLQGRLERADFALLLQAKPGPKGAPTVIQAGAVDIRSSCSADGVQLRNAHNDAPAIIIDVYGGEISQLPRRVFAPDGGFSDAPAVYANDPDAPPYDIHSIQTRIVD
jgi:predicted metal-dependent enzyme (double-stranded beta helix superfamily)